jgi:hypothetical protein
MYITFPILSIIKRRDSSQLSVSAEFHPNYQQAEKSIPVPFAMLQYFPSLEVFSTTEENSQRAGQIFSTGMSNNFLPKKPSF